MHDIKLQIVEIFEAKVGDEVVVRPVVKIKIF